MPLDSQKAALIDRNSTKWTKPSPALMVQIIIWGVQILGTPEHTTPHSLTLQLSPSVHLFAKFVQIILKVLKYKCFDVLKCHTNSYYKLVNYKCKYFLKYSKYLKVLLNLGYICSALRHYPLKHIHLFFK